MRATLAVSSLLFALTLVGCKGNSLDGKWNVSGVQGMPPGSTATYEFSGGNAKMVAVMKQPQLGEMTVTVNGPYKVEGEKLTLDAQSVAIDDTKVNASMKPMLTQLGVKGQIEKGLKENNSYTFKFDSSDQVLLTGKQGTATLTRVK